MNAWQLRDKRLYGDGYLIRPMRVICLAQYTLNTSNPSWALMRSELVVGSGANNVNGCGERKGG